MGVSDSRAQAEEAAEKQLRTEQLRAEAMKAEKLLAEQRLEYVKRDAEKLQAENRRLNEKLQREKDLQASNASKVPIGPLPCHNARFGCTDLMPAEQLPAHSWACFFRLLPCPLKPCSWLGNYNRLFDHAREAHPAHLGIHFGQPTAMSVTKGIWMLRRGSHVFLLHSRAASDPDNQACWTLQLLGPPEEAANWKYEISIISHTEPKKWTAISEMCIAQFEDVERIMEEARCVAIPLIVIKNYFYKNQVTLKLSVFNKFRYVKPKQ